MIDTSKKTKTGGAVWTGHAKADDPIYKEGWSIQLGPSTPPEPTPYVECGFARDVARSMKPKPVGSRPRCLYCNRELRANYGYDVPRPWFTEDYDGAKQKAFEREHKIFKGNYGGYGDNRFCGLNCGYQYAVAHTKQK